MEEATVAIYEHRGGAWAAGVKPMRTEEATAFGEEIPAGEVRLDVGCGAGRYSTALGQPCVGVDAALTMLRLCKEVAPDALLVQADMEHLPFGRRAVSGAWANMSYLHIPKKRLPAALADLHGTLEVGAPFDIQVLSGVFEGTGLPDDRVGGRFFAAWECDQLVDVVAGAGFEVATTQTVQDGPGRTDVVRVRSHRCRTLPDTVGAGMRLLVCGLNPSVYSADAGYGFARKNNRFWPAAKAAGLVTKTGDPRHALDTDHIGMTDIVKRASANASVLTRDEYATGVGRVARLVSWLEPKAVCFVGLAGWRSAVDRMAVAGIQPARFGGRPAYVMPSTSGANASSRMEDLTMHLARAAELADRSRS